VLEHILNLVNIAADHSPGADLEPLGLLRPAQQGSVPRVGPDGRFV
jgi:hypothetical protein